MNALKKAVKLKEKIVVYLPDSIDINGETYTKREVTGFDSHKLDVEMMATVLSMKFGGATVSEGQGYYVTEQGELIEESTTMVTAYAEEIKEEDMNAILTELNVIMHRDAQECMGIEINGEFYLHGLESEQEVNA